MSPAAIALRYAGFCRVVALAALLVLSLVPAIGHAAGDVSRPASYTQTKYGDGFTSTGSAVPHCLGAYPANGANATPCAQVRFNEYVAAARASGSASCAGTLNPASYYAPATWVWSWTQTGQCDGKVPATQYIYDRGSVLTVPSCPDHSVPNSQNGGNTCTCNAGYQPNTQGNLCVLPPDKCVPKLGVAASGELTIPVSGKYITPASACIDGCAYAKTFNSGGGWSGLGTSWSWWGKGSDFVGNGVSCSPAPTGTGSPSDPAAAPTENPAPKGQCQTTLAGATANVACDETGTSPGGAIAPPPPGASGGVPGPGSTGSPGPGSFSGGASSPAPSGSKPGDRGTSSSCKDDVCVTDECIIVLKADLSMERQCGAVGEDKGTFCAKNPGSPNCADMEERDCKDSTALSCLKLGTVPAGPALAVQTKTLAITPTTGWNTATGCPADKVVTVKSLTITFPFTFLCEAADMARPVVIAMAWLSAAFAFIGFARKSS